MMLRNTVRQAKLVVSAEVGLHARPAAMLVKLAQKFNADVTIQCHERLANAKSILSILTLGAVNGDLVKVTTDGPEADAAILAFRTLFAHGFADPAIPQASVGPEPEDGRRPSFSKVSSRRERGKEYTSGGIANVRCRD